MATIASMGIGSGLDIGGLVTSLVASEGASKAARLDRREAQYTAKVSSLATLKASVSDFQGSYSALKSVSTFNAITSNSSDNKVFTASATKGAASGSYDITVTTLAAAQKLQTSSGYMDSDATSIGTGTLTFALQSDIDAGNGVTQNVTITDGTLNGIRDAINAADIGVSANVVFDGSDYQMVLTSKTGMDNRLTITSAEPDLSAFTTGTLTETRAAVDAVFTVDGVGITSATNTITSALSNVTLELLATSDVGASETLTIAKNTSAATSAVQGFVDGYNALMDALNSASVYNADDSVPNGILIGDSTVRGIVNQLRSILNTTVGDNNTQYNSFASIGILTKTDGTLEYDSTKLSTALTEKPNEIQYLFAGGQATTTASDVSIASIPDNLEAGSYIFEIATFPTASTIDGIAANNSGIRFSGTELMEGFELDYTGASTGIIASISVKDGLMDKLDALVNSFLASDGYIDAKTNGLNSSIAVITEARIALNKRMASYEARLFKQFNAMDTMVAQLNNTSTFLTNQLSSLNNLANRK